jgi:hypothetical protein
LLNPGRRHWSFEARGHFFVGQLDDLFGQSVSAAFGGSLVHGAELCVVPNHEHGALVAWHTGLLECAGDAFAGRDLFAYLSPDGVLEWEYWWTAWTSFHCHL